MRVLVVGRGAREHALAWRLRQDEQVEEVWAAPGNPGMAAVAHRAQVEETDAFRILRLVREKSLDLVVVGPELPLAMGVADRLREAGVAVVGPGQKAAQLESSKAFAKEVMGQAGVPTAAYRVATTAAQAHEAVESFGLPVVVKADGLAAGKGVVVASTREEAHQAVRLFLEEGRLGEAGRKLVVEAYLEGPEFSAFALTDGKDMVLLPLAMDHKRLLDGDQGPNTGGMGAVCPVPFLGEQARTRVQAEIFRPILAWLRQHGISYRGFLYAGLKWTAEGPKVLEFNVRLGDPEAQAVLPLLQGSLAQALWHAAQGQGLPVHVAMAPRWAAAVVLAAEGYPATPRLGDRLQGLEQIPPDVLIFFAGVQSVQGHLVTDGGRVLTVVGSGPSLEEARMRAYAAAEKVWFPGRHMRRDIGAMALSIPPLDAP